MATDLVEINLNDPQPEIIARAVREIERGKVVGIPTDALYVLVADPLNLHAVGRVFAAKGRESARSLPLAISDALMAEDLSSELNSRFYILARHFWPGPLTMIVPAQRQGAAEGHWQYGRLALRNAKSKTLNMIIEKIGHAVIATSANKSGKPTINSGH